MWSLWFSVSLIILVVKGQDPDCNPRKLMKWSRECCPWNIAEIMKPDGDCFPDGPPGGQGGPPGGRGGPPGGRGGPRRDSDDSDGEDDERNDGPGPRPTCESIQCDLEMKKILTPDKKVNSTGLLIYLQSNPSQPSDWKPIVDKSTECFKNSNDDSDDCEARKFMRCFMEQTVQACFKNGWAVNESCNNRKTTMSNCFGSN